MTWKNWPWLPLAPSSTPRLHVGPPPRRDSRLRAPAVYTCDQCLRYPKDLPTVSTCTAVRAHHRTYLCPQHTPALSSERVLARPSISSKNTMHGAVARARANSAAMARSLSPTYLENSSPPFRYNVCVQVCACACVHACVLGKAHVW